MKHLETDKYRLVQQDHCNCLFDKRTGYQMRWGETREENPDWSPAGPELLDIELSTICQQGCRWCYKDNGPKGDNMSLAVFDTLLRKLPKTVNQIAFGIGELDANPDLFKILEATRESGVVPNITINDQFHNPKLLQQLTSLCGAIAVSLYSPSRAYSLVKYLTGLRGSQVNLHILASKQTSQACLDAVRDWKHSPKLADLNALVFLSLKRKGRGFDLVPVETSFWMSLITLAKEFGTPIGFDSCSSGAVSKLLPEYEEYIEPCESGLFSLYVNVKGEAFPCSFLEGVEAPLDLKVLSFEDVWNSDPLSLFRRRLLQNGRGCPLTP